MSTVPEILAALKGNNDTLRASALRDARQLGATGVTSLAPLLADPETETRRAGKRAIQSIVHDAGKDGALGDTAAAVEQELLGALGRLTDDQARRDLIWFLSEVGHANTVRALAGLLGNAALRDDARCALERIPGTDSLNALKNAFERAPEDFKFALADSLRKRGETVSGYPSRRLVPVKPTQIQPVA